MNILTELKNELGYANVTNQYIELAARTFQLDHGNDNLQEQAGMVEISIATLPEDYLKRIANGYIIGVQQFEKLSSEAGCQTHKFFECV